MDIVDYSAGGRGYVNGTTDICIEEHWYSEEDIFTSKDCWFIRTAQKNNKMAFFFNTTCYTAIGDRVIILIIVICKNSI